MKYKKTKCLVILFFVLPIAGCGQQIANAPTPTNSYIEFSTEESEVLCNSDDDQARDLYNSALTYEEQGNLESASNAYLAAIEIDPNYCDAMDNLGLILRSQGDVDEAIIWYNRSIEIFPENFVAHQNLASAYLAIGDFENALGEYQILVEIDPDDPEGYYGSGIVYLQVDEPSNAIPHFEKAMELYSINTSPYVIDTQFMLGQAYLFMDDCTTAIGYFESIYTFMEDHPIINYHLGYCYLSPLNKNIELAKDYLIKAQDLGLEVPDEMLGMINE